jgi:hypothetical protein
LIHLHHETSGEGLPVGHELHGLDVGQSDLLPALNAQKLPKILVVLKAGEPLASAHKAKEIRDVQERED